MLGSLIGDIVGSVYESRFRNIKTKDFPLFSSHGRCTDDSTLTVATADWLLHGGRPAEYYLRYAVEHPRAGFGGGFKRWVADGMAQLEPAPAYGSYGNGSAMRVGPVGWVFSTKEETLAVAKQSAECTHNHPEGIKGAQATALAVFMARTGATKAEIRRAIESEIGYDLSFTCDEIRPTFRWSSSCQGSVPQAIVAFLEGTDFEDCLRNAISIGGDSDTIGCITGSIAEAFYGIPQPIREQAMQYLGYEFRAIVTEFERRYGSRTAETPAQ
jgi:ADP-ribosylglycohydrolase